MRGIVGIQKLIILLVLTNLRRAFVGLRFTPSRRLTSPRLIPIPRKAQTNGRHILSSLNGGHGTFFKHGNSDSGWIGLGLT